MSVVNPTVAILVTDAGPVSTAPCASCGEMTCAASNRLLPCGRLAHQGCMDALVVVAQFEAVPVACPGCGEAVPESVIAEWDAEADGDTESLGSQDTEGWQEEGEGDQGTDSDAEFIANDNSEDDDDEEYIPPHVEAADLVEHDWDQDTEDEFYQSPSSSDEDDD